MRHLWWSTDSHELSREEARVREEAVERAIARYDRHPREAGVRGEDGWPVAERRRG